MVKRSSLAEAEQCFLFYGEVLRVLKERTQTLLEGCGVGYGLIVSWFLFDGVRFRAGFGPMPLLLLPTREGCSTPHLAQR